MGKNASANQLFSIGDLLDYLNSEFPDLTISKIRFLENEGLVRPLRAPSGYRKFTGSDLNRIRYILQLQRDHYLPLRVIREHLVSLDEGLEAPYPVTGTVPKRIGLVPSRESLFGVDSKDLIKTKSFALNLDELVEITSISRDSLEEYLAVGLLEMREGMFDSNAIAIANLAKELETLGISARHMRSFRLAAEREIGLIESLVKPVSKKQSPNSRNDALEQASEIATIALRLHTALVRSGIHRELS